MLRLILPAAIIVTAAVGGGTAGYFLRPQDAETAPEQTAGMTNDESGAQAVAEGAGHGGTEKASEPAERDSDEAPMHDYVKMNNQFVIPVVENGRVAALVILSLGLEVPPGGGDAVFAAEPKLRDAFLRVLFDHANSGGFSGSFTESAALAPLRTALLEAGQGVLGDRLSAVLIGDIVRQDN